MENAKRFLERHLGISSFSQLSKAEKIGVIAGATTVAVTAAVFLYRHARAEAAKREAQKAAEDAVKHYISNKEQARKKGEPATPPPSPYEDKPEEADLSLSPRSQELKEALERELKKESNNSVEETESAEASNRSSAALSEGTGCETPNASPATVNEQVNGTVEEQKPNGEKTSEEEQPDFSSMSTKQLRAECSKRGIATKDMVEKENLIKALNAYTEASTKTLSLEDEAEMEVRLDNPLIMTFLGRKMLPAPTVTLADSTVSWAAVLMDGIQAANNCMEEQSQEAKNMAESLIASGMQKATTAGDKIGIAFAHRCKGYFLALVRDQKGAAEEYKEAVTLLEEALGSFNNAVYHERITLLEFTTDAARVLFDAKEYEASISFHNRAIEYAERVLSARCQGRVPLVVLGCQSNVADCKLALGDIKAAENLYNKVLKERMAHVQESRDASLRTGKDKGEGVGEWQMANAILRCYWAAAEFDMAAFYTSYERSEEATPHIDTAKQVLFDLFHSEQGLLGGLLLQIAIQYRLVLFSPVNAWLVMKMSAEALKATHGEVSLEVGQVMVQLADLERSMGRLEEALETVEKAISCLKTVLTQLHEGKLKRTDITESDVMGDLGNSFGAKARLFTELKRYDEAQMYYADAIVMLKKIEHVNVMLIMALYARHLRIVGERDEEAANLEAEVKQFEDEHGIIVNVD